MTPTVKLFVALTFCAFSVGCGAKRFSSANNSSGLDEADGTIKQPCQNQLQQSTIPIKMLFVVDTSGSNANNSTGYIGTDNNKVVRGQSIQEFFNNYKAKTNFSWAINVFSGSTSSALISSDATYGNPAFTLKPTIMQTAINNFFVWPDGSETPYMAALELAKKALVNDGARTQQTKWVVVLISDGLPNPDVPTATLQAKVSEIVGVIPGQVTFNTVYYGPTDADASARLLAMANTGGGKFVNTNNNGRSFPIEDVITIPGVCQ